MGPSFANKDVVYGPTAKKTSRWVLDDRYGIQYKFENGGIGKLKPAFLLPAADLEEPRRA